MILFINLTFFTPDVSEILLVKPVYKGQSRGIPKVASVDRWPLFEASETTYQSFTDKLRLAFVDLKPLFTGVLMHRFDCTCIKKVLIFLK